MPATVQTRCRVFWGAKGGSGTTTVACNFAFAMAAESVGSTVLIDLNLPFGDAILNFGLKANYSVVDALENARRLDGSLLSGMIVRHSSGLSILPAPGTSSPYPFAVEAINKLITVARTEFDRVVVDAGTRTDLVESSLGGASSHAYLVAQTSIADLRNSNRLVSELFGLKCPNFDIVLNRYQASSQTVDEAHIAKALTRPPTWKIPNDYTAVKRMQVNAAPIPLGDSAISRVFRQMARAAVGIVPAEDKKKRIWGLF